MIGPFFPSRSGRFGEGLGGLSVLIVLQRGHLIERVPISAFASILNSRRAHFPQRCSSFIYATQLYMWPPLMGQERP